MIYCLYTLVDITATGQLRGPSSLERSQQQNFDTVLQTIGLCGNIYYNKSPTKVPADIFGIPDTECWYFEWTMEIEGVFEENQDPIKKLKDIFEYVPYISNLTETVKFDQACFKLGRNIIFSFEE